MADVAIEVANRITIDGVSFVDSQSLTCDGSQRKAVTKAAAKTGQLTTRTDNDTGVITATAGHGIIDGRLDVYWDTGSRRGMAVTVATNALSVDLGAGDNLPTNLTNVTLSQPQEEEFLVTGDNVAACGGKASRRGIIVFAESDDTEVLAIVDNFDATNGGGYQWYSGNGITNPLASADVAKVYFSNGDSGNANTMVASVGAN